MTDRALLIGMDVGRLLGVAVGRPGLIPVSYSVALAKPSAGIAAQDWNLIKLMDLLLTGRDPRDPSAPPGPKPFLLVKEAPFALAAMSDKGVRDDTVKSTFGLHLTVEAMCFGYGVRWENAYVSTVTKHFLGSAKTAGRAARKAAIVKRCQDLGYFGRDVNDDDRADACAVFDFASATHARVPPRELRLFDQEVAA